MARSVIVGAVRTPFGKLGGALAHREATELGSIVIRAALDRAGVENEDVEYVVMGQVLQGGAGQAPSRQASVGAGLPIEIGSDTIKTARARPAADLLGYYREAQRRFGVPWNVLASVNFVETKFGKLRSASAAGAQGPMQFMPATWRADRPPRPQVTATVGARPPSAAGLDGLLDFRMDVTLEGEPLTDGEIAALLAGTDTLVLLRGRWVEIDRERLERAMRRFREAQALAERDGLTFAEAVRATKAPDDATVAMWIDGGKVGALLANALLPGRAAGVVAAQLTAVDGPLAWVEARRDGDTTVERMALELPLRD